MVPAVWGAMRFGVVSTAAHDSIWFKNPGGNRLSHLLTLYVFVHTKDVSKYPTIQRVFDEMSKNEAVDKAKWSNQPDCPEELREK